MEKGSDADECPLFINKLTRDAIENNEALEALIALNKEDTPEERFYTLKSHGDECFRNGAKFFEASKSHYLKALEVGHGSSIHKASVCRNLAVIENHTENYGSSIKHCLQVLKVFPKDVQAHYILGLSNYKLGRLDEAERYLREVPTSSKSISDLLAEVEKQKEIVRSKKAEASRRIQNKRDLQRKLAQMIKDSGVKILSRRIRKSDLDPYLEFLGGLMYNGVEAKVEFDPESRCLTWPVVLYYPEYKISELIARFSEDSALADHLDVMFGTEKAPWDEKGYYEPEKIEAFFEPVEFSSGASAKKPILYRVDKNSNLRKVLIHPNMAIAGGCVTFKLFSKISPFYKRILRSCEVIG